jgi:DNA-directed RNA polymerase specialized sigma24 family protein
VGLSNEELLRKFVASRAEGDGDGALHWWGKLIEGNFDRVRAMVDLNARRYGLSADERQEAVQRSLVKLWRRMVHTFEGATMGQWVNATKKLVDFVCRDVQRDAARRSSRETGLDADPESTHPDWKGDELAHQRHRRDAEQAEAADFVAWALPQLTNERRRRVVERTLDGVPAEDIATELDVSMDNLYALRSRGLKDLRALREEWFGS